MAAVFGVGCGCQPPNRNREIAIFGNELRIVAFFSCCRSGNHTVPPWSRSPLMFCERFWSMSIKPTSPLYAESTKSSALARRMSFIAKYLIETAMPFRLLLDRPTLQDGFARSMLLVYEEWIRPCETCRHFAV